MVMASEDMETKTVQSSSSGLIWFGFKYAAGSGHYSLIYSFVGFAELASSLLSGIGYAFVCSHCSPTIIIQTMAEAIPKPAAKTANSCASFI